MSFSCLHCGKTYGSSNAKTNHQRVCGLELALANEREEVANEREEVASLREELKHLRQELLKANSRPTVQHINVLCFGNEPEIPEAMLLQIVQQPNTAIAEYVRNKHFVKPETKNIRIPNKAKNVAQVVRNQKWQDVTKSVVVEELFEDALNHTDEYIDEVEPWGRFRDRLDSSKDASERKRKLYQEQLQSIEHTIINNQ
jgi:hypothetical protein